MVLQVRVLAEEPDGEGAPHPQAGVLAQDEGERVPAARDRGAEEGAQEGHRVQDSGQAQPTLVVVGGTLTSSRRRFVVASLGHCDTGSLCGCVMAMPQQCLISPM